MCFAVCPQSGVPIFSKQHKIIWIEYNVLTHVSTGIYFQGGVL
jgi:hypothetical protein